MNRTNLDLISRSLCIVCLDEDGGDRPDTDADTNAMLRAMHGAGTRYHSANRWFDKAVQVIQKVFLVIYAECLVLMSF